MFCSSLRVSGIGQYSASGRAAMRAQLAVYNSIFDPISDTTIANLIVEIYAKDHLGL